MVPLLQRQLPSGSPIWNDCEFYVDSDIDECDWWVVSHISAIKDEQSAICDPNHVVFVSMEPLDWGCSHFYRQFSTLITTDEKTIHPQVIKRNIHTWWVGINVAFQNGHIFSPAVNLDYDALNAMKLPPKMGRISAITSTNRQWPGHHQRLKFIDELKQSSISHLCDFYGGGTNPILDKFDGIAPYGFHLVLENSNKPDYWTEKLADSFLGFAMPIYYGCPNISKYFPSDAIIAIDISDPQAALAIIEESINQKTYINRLPAIMEARDLILNKYNYFNEIAQVCTNKANRMRRVNIKSNDYFRQKEAKSPRAVLGRLKRKLLDHLA